MLLSAPYVSQDTKLDSSYVCQLQCQIETKHYRAKPSACCMLQLELYRAHTLRAAA